MTQSISAAIHIEGPTIRYAEVGRQSGAPSLRRLGRETCEFGVMRVLWGEEGGADALDQVQAVVQEALEGTDASRVALVVPPLEVYSFFLLVPGDLSDADRERRLAHQAALVTNTRSPDTLHTTSQSVRTVEREEETLEWVHVLTMPQEVEERMRGLTARLSVKDASARVLSSEAAARLLESSLTEKGEEEEAERTYQLAFGQYPTHTEYSLLHQGTWHHALATQEARTVENRVYYALGFLRRIGVSAGEVDRVFGYGPSADSLPNDPFETVFGSSPTALNPFKVLRRVWEHPQEETPGEYVPCIGAALGSSLS